MATLAQAAVGLPKCVAAIGGNDCEYWQQQSTNNLSFMNQVVSLEKTNSTNGQSLAKTIASNFLNNVLRYMDWLYTRDLQRIHPFLLVSAGLKRGLGTFTRSTIAPGLVVQEVVASTMSRLDWLPISISELLF